MIFPFSLRRLETLSERDGMCICVNSFVNTDERNLIAGWAIKQMHIVQDWKGGRVQTRKASFILSTSGDFPDPPPTRGSPTCGDCQHDSLCRRPFAWSSSFFGKVTAEPTECLCLGDLTWKALIQLSFSTWSQIFETENSRPGTIRGKLGVFSHCPPPSFEDSTSWPIPGKSPKPYVSEEDFLEGSSQQMTVPQL